MNKEATILLVDDDEVDILATKRAFRQKKIANHIAVAHDGIEALEILRGENGKEKLEKPFLILLDLNMPRMTGFEFLDVIREDPHLKDSIVFVLTTSNNDEDRCQAYDRNIAGYILKSNVGDNFIHAVSMLKLYWRVVEMPL